MTRDVIWMLDLTATLGTLFALLVAYRRLGRFRRTPSATGMSYHYVLHAVSVSVFAMVYAGVIALFNLGSSWLVGPTACAVILVDMIHIETNRHR